MDRSKQILLKPIKVFSDTFNVTTRLNDIAILHVPGISTANIAISNIAWDGVHTHQHNLTMVGWGSTIHNKSAIIPLLPKQATLQLNDLNVCRSHLISSNNMYRHVIISNDSNLCLLNQHATACYVSKFYTDSIQIRRDNSYAILQTKLLNTLFFFA